MYEYCILIMILLHFSHSWSAQNERKISSKPICFLTGKSATRLRAPAFLQRSLDRRTRQAHRVATDADGGCEVCEDPRTVLMEAVRQDVAGGQGGERGLNSFSISTQSAMPNSIRIVIKYTK